MDDRLQDYLDGRLSKSERESFEASLRDDPESAAEVRAYRGIGEVLRSEPPELSADFYARAQERFEQASGRRSWLSWPTAGLAAAAVLAALLFLPRLIDRQAPAVAGQSQTEPSTPPAPEKAPAGWELTPTEGRQPAPANQAPPPREESARALRDDESEIEGAARVESADQGEPVAQRQRMDQLESGTREFHSDSQDKESYTLIGPDAAGATKSEPAAEPERQNARYVIEGDQTRFPAMGSRLAAARETAVPVAPAALPATFPIGPGDVITLDDAAAWSRLLRESSGRALAKLTVDPSRRLVLVGVVGADCSGVRVAETAGQYEVRIPSSALGTDTSSPGCALTLPRDGKPVALVESTGGPDGP